MTEKEILEKTANVYFEDQMQLTEKKFREAHIKSVLPHIKGNVLEIGCGDGLCTEAVLTKCEHITLIEPSSILVEKIKNKFGEKVKIYNDLIENVEITDKFDTILLMSVLEHVDDPIAVLKKVTPLLKGNGRVIIVVPNAFSLHRRIGTKLGILKKENELSDSDRTLNHRRIYSKDTLLDDIKKSGMTVENIEGISLKPLANSQMDKLPKEVIEAYANIGKEFPAEYTSSLMMICKK